MLNQSSIEAVRKSTFSSKFCRPLYDSYCFSRIPDTIRSLLGIEAQNALPQDTFIEGTYDAVILLLVDGFGWKMFERYLDRFPFLQEMVNRGVVSKITSQFPSTTAVHVTTINSGLSLPRHGIYEWFYYEPVVDRVIAPIPFSFAGDHQISSLKKAGIVPEDFLPTSTFYESLKKEGINPYVVQQASIADSPYSLAMSKGAKILPYHTLPEALIKIDSVLAQEKNKSYFFVYFPDLDAVGHRKGIESEAFEHCLQELVATLERHLLKKTDQKIALMITADHGMIAVEPTQTLYLNRLFPNFEKLIKKNRAGDPIVPAGSARDFFLHIREESLDEAEALLKEKLQGSVEVHRTKQLLEEGLFGIEKPSQQFINRLGNLVLLPLGHETIWWYVKGHFEQHFHALHGGLSREEMEIPFLFSKI